jgi:hypothetical protein
VSYPNFAQPGLQSAGAVAPSAQHQTLAGYPNFAHPGLQSAGAVAPSLQQQNLASYPNYVQPGLQSTGAVAPSPFVGSATGYPFVQVPQPSSTIPFTSLSTGDQDTATTSSLAANPALQHINNLSINAAVKDILGIEDCGRAGQNKKGEKPMLPVDFVTIIPGAQIDEDEVLNEHNGIELVLRQAGSKKPTADRLTTGQYIEASNIILQLLLPTFSLQDLSDYIEYQRMIGYFMQIFNIGSVFLLDNEF